MNCDARSIMRWIAIKVCSLTKAMLKSEKGWYDVIKKQIKQE